MVLHATTFCSTFPLAATGLRGRQSHSQRSAWLCPSLLEKSESRGVRRLQVSRPSNRQATRTTPQAAANIELDRDQEKEDSRKYRRTVRRRTVVAQRTTVCQREPAL